MNVVMVNGEVAFWMGEKSWYRTEVPLHELHYREEDFEKHLSMNVALTQFKSIWFFQTRSKCEALKAYDKWDDAFSATYLDISVYLLGF